MNKAETLGISGVFGLVARLQPMKFGGTGGALIPDEPGIGRGAAAGARGVFHVEGDAFAEDPDAGGRVPQENRPGAVCSFEEGEAQQQCKFAAREFQALGHEAFGAVERRIGDDVFGAAGRGQEVQAFFAVAARVKVACEDLMTGLLENLSHRAVAAGAFPDFAVESLIIDKRMRCPGWGREEVGAVEIGAALEGGFEGAVEVVGWVGHGGVSLMPTTAFCRDTLACRNSFAGMARSTCRRRDT